MKTTPLGERLGRSIATFSIRYRWALMPAIILGTILISSGAANLKFSGDYRVFFGPECP